MVSNVQFMCVCVHSTSSPSFFCAGGRANVRRWEQLFCLLAACRWRRSGHGQYVRIWYVRWVQLEFSSCGGLLLASRGGLACALLRNGIGTAVRVPVDRERKKQVALLSKRRGLSYYDTGTSKSEYNEALILSSATRCSTCAVSFAAYPPRSHPCIRPKRPTRTHGKAGALCTW